MRKRKKKKARTSFLSTVLVLLGLSLMAYFMGRFVFLDTWRSRQRADQQAQAELKKQVHRLLLQMGVLPTWIEQSGRETTVRIPIDMHPLLFYQKIAEHIEKVDGTITQGVEDRKTRTLTFTYALHRQPVEKIRLVPDPTLVFGPGEIAIIIDDFGYNMGETVRKLIEFPVPLSYSIIPGLPYSKKLARLLHEKGKTVLIHMPMEPLQGQVESDGYTLLTALPSDEIESRVRRAVEDVPFATGLNNHMGSRATTDSTLLAAAFAELKQHKLFYVDSRTNSQSIAYDMALAAGIPALKNTLFLDAVDDSAHVAMKLLRLADTARKKGRAVGIGHPRKNTLAALQALIPILQAQGITFTSVETFFQPIGGSIEPQ